MGESESIAVDLFKSGISLFLGSILGTFGTFISRTISARFLTPDSYGALALGLSIVTASATIVLLGLDQGLGRNLPRYDQREDKRRILLAAFTTSVPVAILGGVVLILIGPALGSVFSDDLLTGRIFRLLGFALPWIVLMKLCIGGIQGLEYSFPRVFVQDFTIPATRLGLLGIVIYLGFGATGIATAFVLSFFAAAVMAIYFLLKQGPIYKLSDIQFRGLTRERWRLLSFTIPLTITGVMSILFSNIDNLMIGYLSTTANVAKYDIAYLLSNFLVVVLGSFLFLFMPIFSRLHSEGKEDKMKVAYTLVTKWVFIITFPLLLIFVMFPEAVIGLTFGQEYVSGSIALIVLSIGFFSNVATGPNGNALIALGETRFIMFVNIFVAITNLVLNLLLIPRYSILGAAVATASSYALLNILCSLQLHAKTGIHPLSSSALKLIVGSVFSLAVVYNLTPRSSVGEYFWPLIVILAFLFLYLLLVLWLARFTQEELEIVGLIETRTGIDLGLLKQLLRT